MIDLMDRKVTFANAYLNRLYQQKGLVTSPEVFSVVSQSMLDNGCVVLIADTRQLRGKPSGDIEFITTDIHQGGVEQ